ncbi:MAG TPA: response regulator [Desulfobacteria bacterium]|nr:response regulator [Desulfobacteria bacterium]
MSEKKIWVLLVEDNKLIRKLRSLQLYKAGFQMLSAEDGVKALEMLEFCSPDCILLDILMPKMHGYAFLEKLRKKEKSLPVIIVSDIEKNAKLVATMERLGIQGWISKQTPDTEIARLIHKAVSPSGP